ncbi:MAG: hypothetical protein AB7N54_03710 [Alphaproteobacteria bacterium]
MAVAPETGLVMGLAPGESPGGAFAVAAGEDDGAFAELLDILNPLQHVPIVSSLYREVTDDPISTPAKLAGGALFGGPIGFLAALANMAVEATTGRDIGGHAMAMLGGDGESEDAPLPDQLAGDDAAQAQLAAADPIVWNAPRVLPQRLSAPPAAESDMPVVAAAAAPPPVPPAAWPVRAGAAVADGPPSGWLARTMAEASAMRTAQAAGVPPPQHPTAQPWMPAAMQHALDKYEALARSR